jgi:hypothetical protein
MSYKYPRIPVGGNRRVKLNQVSNHLLLRIIRRDIDLNRCFNFQRQPLPNMVKVMTLARELLTKRRCI